MGKKKKGGILGRQSAAAHSTHAKTAEAKKKPAQRESSQHGGTLKQQRPDAKASVLSSPLQQQCAVIVSKLLHGVNQRRSSGSLKTLCLAPSVQVLGQYL